MLHDDLELVITTARRIAKEEIQKAIAELRAQCEAKVAAAKAEAPEPKAGKK